MKLCHLIIFALLIPLFFIGCAQVEKEYNDPENRERRHQLRDFAQLVLKEKLYKETIESSIELEEAKFAIQIKDIDLKSKIDNIAFELLAYSWVQKNKLIKDAVEKWTSDSDRYHAIIQSYTGDPPEDIF